ncbi:unnamed protein product [Cunninghamella echinulata]
MGQQEQNAYPPGTIVFAKLKGYPWWPAKIEDERTVPAKVLKQKTKTKSPVWTVFFFGSRDYGFFGPDSIRPFNRANVEKDLKARKFKTKDLELAVREALDPSALEEEDDEREEENEEEEQNETPLEKKRKAPTAKGGKKNSKATTNKKSTTTTTKATTPTTMDTSDQDDMDTSSANKKRGITDKEDNKKKRRKSMSTEKEDIPNGEDHTATSLISSRKSEEGSAKDGIPIEETREYKKLYHLRHRLQKLIYEKKDGEIPEEDYPKISQHLKDVEEAYITYTLLKQTKIGKVVKAGCGYNFTNDTEYNLRDRCNKLMRKWKEIFLNSNEQVKDNGVQKVSTSTT